jgi:phosphoribosylaminoimidazole carboxylase (NCAIR synthetase)
MYKIKYTNEKIRQITKKCRKIISLCEEFQNNNNNFINNNVPMHYNVRILKYMPGKVLINGKIKDRISLSARERQAVKTQEEVDQARAKLRLENILKRKSSTREDF